MRGVSTGVLTNVSCVAVFINQGSSAEAQSRSQTFILVL